MEQSLLRFAENYPGVVTRCLALKKEEIVNKIIFALFSFLLLRNIRGTNCKCFQNNI